jgi:hypothetical protein
VGCRVEAILREEKGEGFLEEILHLIADLIHQSEDAGLTPTHVALVGLTHLEESLFLGAALCGEGESHASSREPIGAV